MKVVDNIIVEATELELYKIWLNRYSDLYDFEAYKKQMMKLGVIVKNED